MLNSRYENKTQFGVLYAPCKALTVVELSYILLQVTFSKLLGNAIFKILLLIINHVIIKVCELPLNIIACALFDVNKVDVQFFSSIYFLEKRE